MYIFNDFGSFSIFGVVQHGHFDVLNRIMFPQIFTNSMKRADKMIVIFDGHVLEDEFSFPFRSPIIPYNGVGYFFIVDETTEED